MNNVQTETLIGLLLGDGHLSKHKNGKNAILQISRKQTDKNYLNYQMTIFSNYNPTCYDGQSFDKRTNKIYYYSIMKTKANIEFTQFWNKWYLNNKKIIPNNIKLTPTIVAIWFADDGCIAIQPGKYYVKLATHGFKYKEVIFLKKELYKLKIRASIYRDNSGMKKSWFLYICGKDKVKSFVELIDPVFPSGMERKSNIWRNNFNLLIKKINPSCPYCKSKRVKKDGLKIKPQYKCKNCRKMFLTIRIKKPSIVLNKQIVKSIRQLWNTKKYTKHELCKKFKTSLSTIHKIVMNKIWT